MPSDDDLTPRDRRLLKLVSELRARGVLQAKVESGDLVLEVALSPEPETPGITEEQRHLLLNSPDTPEQMKEKLRLEYERDLYASS